MENKTKKKRIFYFDALRALAILSVILFHCFNTVVKGDVVFHSVHPSMSWVAAVLLGSYSRVGVNIFLMLSGALSLGRQWDIKTFLGKRIPRIILPFLFWGFAICVFIIIFGFYYPHVFNPIGELNVMSFMTYLYNCYMAHNVATTSYWFFWMILGTYLIMPILNRWLLHADLKEAEYFLVIWAVVCIFKFTLEIPPAIKLDYFSGPIGLVVLGYYLRYTERKIFKNPYFIAAMFVFSFIMVFFNSFDYSLTGEFHNLSRYNIFTVIEVIGIFSLFRYLSEHDLKYKLSENSIVRKAVFALAKYSYGLYLIHRPVIIVFFFFIASEKIYSFIVLLFILSTVVSTAIMAVLNRIPYLNQVIGAK